jgi:type IV secretory pathway TrbD component
MRHRHATRTIGRTVVLASWLLALAVAGDPNWLAALLGVVLGLVWVSPYVLATNREPLVRRPPARALPAVEPGSAGPAS